MVRKLKGRTAAEVLRPLVVKAGELDLSWILRFVLLDALCHLEFAFAIKRRGERVQWVLNPFRDPPEASGDAETIGDAIDALRAARTAMASNGHGQAPACHRLRRKNPAT